MTRGNLIAIVSKNEIYMSPQYNGDMYPDGNGVKAYIALDGVETKEDFEETVKDFQDETFPDYGDFTIFRIPDLDFGNAYYKRFNSDYLYIKNISGSDFTITAKDSKEPVVIGPGEIQTWDFGKLVEPDFESMPMVKMFRKAQEKTEAECSEDLSGLTMDDLVDACKKKTDYEYEQYLEDLLDKPAFAVLEQAERYLAMKLAHTGFDTFLNQETRVKRRIYELILEANYPVRNAATEYLSDQDRLKQSRDMLECMFYSLMMHDEETKQAILSSFSEEQEEECE